MRAMLMSRRNHDDGGLMDGIETDLLRDDPSDDDTTTYDDDDDDDDDDDARKLQINGKLKEDDHSSIKVEIDSAGNVNDSPPREYVMVEAAVDIDSTSDVNELAQEPLMEVKDEHDDLDSPDDVDDPPSRESVMEVEVEIVSTGDINEPPREPMMEAKDENGDADSSDDANLDAEKHDIALEIKTTHDAAGATSPSDTEKLEEPKGTPPPGARDGQSGEL
eukprot:g2683.t1